MIKALVIKAPKSKAPKSKLAPEGQSLKPRSLRGVHQVHYRMHCIEAPAPTCLKSAKKLWPATGAA